MEANRRAVLRGAGAVLAAGLGPAVGLGPAAGAQMCTGPAESPSARGFSGRPLGTIAPRVVWGSAIATPALTDGALIGALTAEKPNFVAVASGLKFGWLYPSEAQCLGGEGARWDELDGVVDLATRLGVPYRGDCIAWNDWLPTWLTDIAAARKSGWQSKLRSCFERHFSDVTTHVVGLNALTQSRMRWCGLVNEPFNPWAVQNGVASWRGGAWLDAYGTGRDGVPGYIYEAFTFGEQLRRKTGARLFLNEANCENDHFGPVMRPAMLKLVDALQRAGHQFDVGLECHLIPNWMNNVQDPDWTPFAAFLRALAQRGVRIFLTELDVIDCAVRDKAARDQLVARTLGGFVEACLGVPAVEMVTNWDLSDKYSWWRDDIYPTLGPANGCVPNPPCPRPDIYDQAMRPKPARRSLAEALAAAARR